jgi:hypothetical protein
MTEPDNLVLVMMREMRASQERIEGDLAVQKAENAAIRDDLRVIKERVTRIESQSFKWLRQFIGHRTMVERSFASLEEDYVTLKNEVEDLRRRQG